MGIFNLNPDEQTPELDVTKIFSSENKQVGVKEDGTTDQVVNEESDKEKKNTTLVMAGPLGHIYTKALNVAYAIESTMMTDMADLQTSDLADVLNNDDSDLYVYCVDGSDLSIDQVSDTISNVTIADEILEKEGKDTSVPVKVIIAVECDNGISPNVHLLEQFGKDKGIQVMVTRKSALEAIRKAFDAMSTDTI